jgi:hypothetical protein
MAVQLTQSSVTSQQIARASARLLKAPVVIPGWPRQSVFGGMKFRTLPAAACQRSGLSASPQDRVGAPTDAADLSRLVLRPLKGGRLSGLARAFSFAGALSMLITHRSVNDASAFLGADTLHQVNDPTGRTVRALAAVAVGAGGGDRRYRPSVLRGIVRTCWGGTNLTRRC